MNSKLENMLLTKEFEALSTQEKLFVRTFIKDFEYNEYRNLLNKSKEAFLADKIDLQEPNVNKDLLLQAFSAKYNSKTNSSIPQRIGIFMRYSKLKYVAIAATVLLLTTILGATFKNGFFTSEIDIATEYLLDQKESRSIKNSNDVVSLSETTNLYVMENDSLINELNKMNEHLVIRTEGLNVEVVYPNEER